MFMIQKILLLLKKKTRRMFLWLIIFFAKRKTKEKKSNININNDFWKVICQIKFSGKSKPIGIVNNIHQRNIFTILWAKNKPNYCLRWFLDKDNIEIVINFKNSINNKVILSNIL